jgi:hypothetical protein
MHTIVTKKLLEGVMRGEITTHEQASAWVSSHDAEIVAESERHTLPQQTTRR